LKAAFNFSVAFAILVVLLLRQNDEEAAEDGDDVDEEIDAVPNEVVVAVAFLLDNQLGVEQNAAAHHRQSQIQLRRVQQSGSHEDVSQRQREHDRHTGTENASQEQVGPFVSVKRGQGKADKDDRGAQKCSWNDLWVNGRHVADQTTQTDAGGEGKSKSMAMRFPMLAVV